MHDYRQVDYGSRAVCRFWINGKADDAIWLRNPIWDRDVRHYCPSWPYSLILLLPSCCFYFCKSICMAVCTRHKRCSIACILYIQFCCCYASLYENSGRKAQSTSLDFTVGCSVRSDSQYGWHCFVSSGGDDISCTGFWCRTELHCFAFADYYYSWSIYWRSRCAWGRGCYSFLNTCKYGHPFDGVSADIRC